jgi:hypothetical protein
MKRKRSTKILPRKFEPAVPGNVKLKLSNINHFFTRYWKQIPVEFTLPENT